jgi:hypothetical protein
MKATVASLVVIASIMLLAGSILAAEMSDGGGYYGSGTTYDGGVPFAITWTNSYAGSYTDYGTYQYFTTQRQGGCNVNSKRQPFASTVGGDVTYYYNGGHGPDISATYAATLCNADDDSWGEGTTTSGIVYYNSDPAGSDYVHIASQWICAECLPQSYFESHNRVWR